LEKDKVKMKIITKLEIVFEKFIDLINLKKFLSFVAPNLLSNYKFKVIKVQ